MGENILIWDVKCVKIKISNVNIKYHSYFLIQSNKMLEKSRYLFIY